MTIQASLIRIAEARQRIDAYLAGFQHGISLAQLDAWRDDRIKEIKELNKILGEDHGKESGPQDHPADQSTA